VWGNGGVVPPINVGARWRCLASCIPWPLPDMRKEPPVPIEHETEGVPDPVWPLRRLPGVESSLAVAHLYSAQIYSASLTFIDNNKLYILV
jgi:hypothetical protein